jgi:homoserine dehydrogenase
LVLCYAELQALSQEHQGQLYMSAATAAPLPTLDVGQTCLAGTQILSIEGILNGTTNFILTKMQDEGYQYLDALQEAQARGIAETDPTLDVEGFDTANKLLLLSNILLGTGYGPNDVSRHGMAHITPQMVMDARRAGKCLKLIGRAGLSHGRVRLSVAPEELALDHPLASVHGAEKAVTYETDTKGRVTVMGGQSSPTGASRCPPQRHYQPQSGPLGAPVGPHHHAPMLLEAATSHTCPVPGDGGACDPAPVRPPARLAKKIPRPRITSVE